MSVFVFGSNLAGRHGKGAALYAFKNHGARYGQGVGRMGNSYGIPTKDESLKVLSLDVIATHVRDFLEYAALNSSETFQVTAIECGLAGFSPSQIAPMFKGAPSNCELPPEFQEHLKERDKNETDHLGD